MQLPPPAAPAAPTTGRKGLSRRGSWLWGQSQQVQLDAEPDGWTPPLLFAGLPKVCPIVVHVKCLSLPACMHI